MASILSVDDLTVRFAHRTGTVDAVAGASLRVAPNECLGIVGESASGKTQLFLAAMGLLGGRAEVSGSIRFAGEELLGKTAAALNAFRGSRLTMIFQDPMTSLTPHLRIGTQLAEVLVCHSRLSWSAARTEAGRMLERVRMPDAKRRLQQYPYELSGGMRQRVMLAMSLLCKPDLLIADEPTTALDVTLQAQIMELLRITRGETGMALVLISHDLGVIAGLADRILVMYAGRIVENARRRRAFAPTPPSLYRRVAEMRSQPDRAAPGAHADSRRTAAAARRTSASLRLRAALPARRGALPPGASGAERRLELASRLSLPIAMSAALLEVRNLRVEFGPQTAVSDVNFALFSSETVGLVGESGAGKSSLARALLRLLQPACGSVELSGLDLLKCPPAVIRAQRRNLQMVFQDPLASLNPRMRIGNAIAEPLLIFAPELSAGARRRKIAAILQRVGLDLEVAARYPHELSGGQCQRMCIARATVLRPEGPDLR